MKTEYEIGIIGTGFSGIIAAINLLAFKRKSFIIFERSSDVGGVWRDNTYPGCSCDIRSSLYSIKREPNPSWSSSFAVQAEILDYLKNIVKKFQIEKHIAFNTLINAMEFDEEKGTWTVFSKKRTFTVKVMILGTGPQRLPAIPVLKGQDLFEGNSFHSARWDHQVDLRDLNIAVIGTGASSIQIVPQVAKKAANLFVFQRSPPWILPKWDKKVSHFTQWIYRRFPVFQKIVREFHFWFLEIVGTALFKNSLLNDLLKKIAVRKIKKEVLDPLLVKKLIPNYPIGCKRVLISDNYYPSLNLPHVILVSDPIDEVTDHSIKTPKREFPVDVIIYATGFTVADSKDYIEIKGLSGLSLNQEWLRNGIEAFLGVNVAGYPNLCFLLGPNSGLTHSSSVHVMESQIAYIMQYLAYMDGFGKTAALDVKPDVQSSYNLKLQEKLRGTVWDSGCQSWFINEKGKNTVIFPGLLNQYRQQLRKFNPDNYIVRAGSIPKKESEKI